MRKWLKCCWPTARTCTRDRTTTCRTRRCTPPWPGGITDSRAVLLAHGADVNAAKHGGWTPLHAAAQNGDVELARLLISPRRRRQGARRQQSERARSGADQRSSGGGGSAGRARSRLAECWKTGSRHLQADALERIAGARTLESLEAVRVDVLGRKGSLAQFSKEFGKLTPDERAAAGKALNAAKQALEAGFAAKQKAFEDAALNARLARRVDRSHAPRARRRAPAACIPLPRFRPKSRTCSPPSASPCWTARKWKPSTTISTRSTSRPSIPRAICRTRSGSRAAICLRTHTSPVQVRGMERLGPPLRMIAPGRVFRNEEVDASHEHTFYQLEGMMIDREVSVANLIYFMKTMLSSIFQRDVTVRLRPGYFPFVEPGFELDIQCLICGGPGCPVCKHSGWVELLPVRPGASATCCDERHRSRSSGAASPLDWA